MNRFLSYPKSLIAIIVSVTLTLAFLPCSAFASNSNNLARSCFSNTELSRLFEKCSLSECEFVMHDYDTGKDNYLKVREKYRERYENLVGADDTWAEEIGHANIDPSLDVEDSSGEGSGGGSGSASPDTGGSVADRYKSYLENLNEAA